MKPFFIPLLSLILFCFSTVCGSSLQAPSTEQCAYTSIRVVDKNSPTKNETIQDLLSLQKSLIISIQEPIPESSSKIGFLLVPMTPEYVSQLLEQKDGQIVCAYQDQNLIGYILLTDVSEFLELYQNENIGRLETSIEEASLNGWLAGEKVGYIEQIAVNPEYARMGIGSVLITESKNLKPEGLIADIFIYPIINEPSLNFFSHQGFIESGILHQNSTANANFPYAHRTQVFFWNELM